MYKIFIFVYNNYKKKIINKNCKNTFFFKINLKKFKHYSLKF